MITRERWKRGPEFLWQEEEAWPSAPDETPEIAEDDKEVKKEARSCVVEAREYEDPVDKLLRKYSCWYSLKRILYVTMGTNPIRNRWAGIQTYDCGGHTGSPSPALHPSLAYANNEPGRRTRRYSPHPRLASIRFATSNFACASPSTV